MRRFIALLLLYCVCDLASKASAAVVITSDETKAEVYYNGSTVNTNVQSNTGGTIAVATLPGYSSTVTSFFNSATMSASFVQSRGEGPPLSYSQGEIITYFTTDWNAPYTASGSFSNSANLTHLTGSLYDVTTGTYVFESTQQSRGGPAVFTLGGTAGNYENTLSGSLTGTLLAGHSYKWDARAYTQAYPSTDHGATASGYVSLTIPEQCSAIVWSLLALTIGGAGWWQRLRLAA